MQEKGTAPQRQSDSHINQLYVRIPGVQLVTLIRRVAPDAHLVFLNAACEATLPSDEGGNSKIDIVVNKLKTILF